MDFYTRIVDIHTLKEGDGVSYGLGFIADHPTKIAVIGSRNNSEYGKNITDKICEDLLTNEGVVIVNGLAKGIDSIAHKTCLSNNGKTIAVLGNGLNVIMADVTLDGGNFSEDSDLEIGE